MFNFREELEHLKKAKTDRYQYEAEEFLQGAIKRLKESGTELLERMETFDIQYSDSETINNFCFISAGINNGISYSKNYDAKTGKKVFKKIEETIGQTCFYLVKKEKNYIHVHL